MGDVVMVERPAVVPVKGRLFREAVRLPIEGAKRRKIVVLLAAHVDGGWTDEPLGVEQLCARLSVNPKALEQLSRRLAEDGWLIERWAPKSKPARRAWVRGEYRFVLDVAKIEGGRP